MVRLGTVREKTYVGDNQMLEASDALVALHKSLLHANAHLVEQCITDNDIEVYRMFPQHFGNGSMIWGGMGTTRSVSVYMVVLKIRKIRSYVVYCNGMPAYEVPFHSHYNQTFFEDLNNAVVDIVDKAEKRYGAIKL